MMLNIKKHRHIVYNYNESSLFTKLGVLRMQPFLFAMFALFALFVFSIIVGYYPLLVSVTIRYGIGVDHLDVPHTWAIYTG